MSTTHRSLSHALRAKPLVELNTAARPKDCAAADLKGLSVEHECGI